MARDGPSRPSAAVLLSCITAWVHKLRCQQAQVTLPKQANAVLMVPLHNGQQVLAVLQGQLADVDQALLIVGAQDSTPIAGHRGLLPL